MAFEIRFIREETLAFGFASESVNDKQEEQVFGEAHIAIGLLSSFPFFFSRLYFLIT